ncbi:MAG: FMN-binding glutamate synthase family protein, partial [Bdellovibrionales bacterium]|nr:FMN-binding glutamate synthase family protein [Bdellovibrionales bacterium]
MRTIFFVSSFVLVALTAALGVFVHPAFHWLFVLVIPIVAIGLHNAFQTKRAILRNFPILGIFRYVFEEIRPEIQQYFVENDTDGAPFSRELRSVVYQRAKRQRDTVPFGTQRDLYEAGAEWVQHSLKTTHTDPASLRVTIGNHQCRQPYSASIFNISAMSYGSLSANAVRALNGGAKLGGFYHNTGEGGVSPHHLAPGGDLVWQIGTGYFGCRNLDGTFSSERFRERAKHPNIKMIEIKLSQGAKPSHGGMLPGAKVTAEVAEIRGVEIGKDVNSPPAHSKFEDAQGLLRFVAELRELSEGKPIGFKLCIGNPAEFASICRAMKKLDIYPDFITVDGAEGGTGAAPLEFTNSLGMPWIESLTLVRDTLDLMGLKKHIKIITAGKVVTAFHLMKALALGADVVNSARGMMLALGCIQARRCNTNHCPAGVATNDPNLTVGLVIEDKKTRVANFHGQTLKAFAELMGACGLSNTSDIRRSHIYHRAATR